MDTSFDTFVYKIAALGSKLSAVSRARQQLIDQRKSGIKTCHDGTPCGCGNNAWIVRNQTATCTACLLPRTLNHYRISGSAIKERGKKAHQHARLYR